MAHFLTRDQGDRGDVGGKEVLPLGVLLCFVFLSITQQCYLLFSFWLTSFESNFNSNLLVPKLAQGTPEYMKVKGNQPELLYPTEHFSVVHKRKKATKAHKMFHEL